MKRNEKTWRKLKSIFLSIKSETKMPTYFMIPTV